MNTKSLNKEYIKIQESFDNIFSPQDEEDKLELAAKMLMAQFLAIVQEEADRRQLKRKELAELVGTSPSYLTQLFRGHKLMNLSIAAKFEHVLGIRFEIKKVSNKRTYLLDDITGEFSKVADVEK